MVAKFGFTSLALVRSSKPANNNPGHNSEASSKKDVEAVSVDDSKKTDQQSITEKGEDGQTSKAILESTDYHSFKGFLLHKVRPKTEITLGK